MQSKVLRYPVYVLSIIVFLIALTYPLAYAGLYDFTLRMKEGAPFYALALHLFGYIAHHDIVFLVHVLGGMVALAMGPFQFMDALRRSRPGLHRKLGYVYFAGILAGGVGGLIVAPRAWGGQVTHWGFALLAVAWLASSARGLRLATQRRISDHQAWMRLSYGITLASVSLRIQMPLLLLAGLSEEHVYQCVAWSCWLPQLAWWGWRGRITPKPTPDLAQTG
jgi:uncharacterized membrane protein